MKNFVLILWMASLQAFSMELDPTIAMGTDTVIPMGMDPSVPTGADPSIPRRTGAIIPIGTALAPLHHGPFNPTAELDQQHWDRLLYLSMVRNNVDTNPFTAEQQEVFRTECAKKNRQANLVKIGIGLALFSEALGYIAFVGVGNQSIANIITPIILPTAAILSILFGLYTIGYEPYCAGVYDGLTLTLHEVVLEELDFLALFLVRKSFSKDQEDIRNVQTVIANMDIAKLQEAYAMQGNAQPHEVSSLTKALEEALVYVIKEDTIDISAKVGDEIRICLLEEAMAEFMSQKKYSDL